MGNPTEGRMFRHYRYGKWISTPISHNILGVVGKKIAIWLKLTKPERYTGHCWRRMAVTTMAEQGASTAQMKKFGWTTDATALEYIENTNTGKKDTARLLLEDARRGNQQRNSRGAKR